MNRDNKKAFIRILKDINVYSEWVRLRKQYCLENEFNDLWLYLPNSFSNAIAHSFTWTTSTRCEMWMEINSCKPSVKLGSKISDEPVCVINDKHFMDDLKKIVIKYTKNG